METIIGWDAEEAFAERMADAARVAGVPELDAIPSLLEAGEYGLVVASAIRAGVPVTTADTELALYAFSDAASPHVAKFVRLAVEFAKITA